MSAACAARTATAIAIDSLEQQVEITEDFTLRVLQEQGDALISARAIKVVGRRLIAQVPEELAAGAGIRIDCQDSFLLGEVLGCWRQRGSTFVAVELVQALTKLRELASYLDESAYQRVDVVREIRRSA